MLDSGIFGHRDRSLKKRKVEQLVLELNDSLTSEVEKLQNDWVGLENRITEEEDKTVYISINPDEETTETLFNGDINLSGGITAGGGILFTNGNYVGPSNTALSLSAQDGKILAESDLESSGDIKCNTLQVVSSLACPTINATALQCLGVTVGASPNQYPLPTVKGSVGHVLTATVLGTAFQAPVSYSSEILDLQTKTQHLTVSGVTSVFSNPVEVKGDVKISSGVTMLYTLPAVSPSAVNQTLICTNNTTKALEWTSPSSYRCGRFDSLGVNNFTLTTLSDTFDYSFCPQMNVSNQAGGATFTKLIDGVRYDGAYARAANTSFSVTLELNADGKTTIQVLLKLLERSTNTLWSSTITELKGGDRVNLTLCSSGVISPVNRLDACIRVLSVGTFNIFCDSPMFSINMS